MSAIRPLPPRPSLEFEHKEAKALVRLLRSGDAEALARAKAQHPALDMADAAGIPLADAQLVIAREYGFASWPRLVRYFRDVERQRHNQRSVHFDQPQIYDMQVRSLIAGHGARHVPAGRALAAYVPRFYGLRADDIFAATITEDDARLAVARQYAMPSWGVLQERIAAEARQHPQGLAESPYLLAIKVMEVADLDELRRVVAAHPDLLKQTDNDLAMGRSLMRSALHFERTLGRARLAPIIEWLVSQGFDVQLDLNRQLCGRMRMETEDVRWLLERGADPDWVAPNGIPVLEFALIRYWNGEAVDLIAARAHPRRGLWIAAGLGDVDGVRGSFDACGKPTEAAVALRPDFDAVGQLGMMPPTLDASDEEMLMEAFFVAVINGRTAVLEEMVTRGAPLNSLVFGSPMVSFAVGNAMAPVVESLVRCGADLDLTGWGSQYSARQMARELFEERPEAPGRRRIVEACGMDPDAVLAERDARPVPPPEIHPMVREALELAGDDAARLGQDDIRPENLLVGLLRCSADLSHFVIRLSAADLERFRADFGERILPSNERLQRTALLLHPDSQALVQESTTLMTERRRDLVNVYSLLFALTRNGQGVVPDLLARYGGSVVPLNAQLEQML